MLECKGNKKSPRVDERYVSFEGIDCFENSCLVIDNLIRVLENKALLNPYREKMLEDIPKPYFSRDAKLDKSEEVLYFVCSKVFYIEELFDEAEDEVALESLKVCELECC